MFTSWYNCVDPRRRFGLHYVYPSDTVPCYELILLDDRVIMQIIIIVSINFCCVYYLRCNHLGHAIQRLHIVNTVQRIPTFLTNANRKSSGAALFFESFNREYKMKQCLSIFHVMGKRKFLGNCTIKIGSRGSQFLLFMYALCLVQYSLACMFYFSYRSYETVKSVH